MLMVSRPSFLLIDRANKEQTAVMPAMIAMDSAETMPKPYAARRRGLTALFWDTAAAAESVRMWLFRRQWCD
jgi:hypothetical protein